MNAIFFATKRAFHASLRTMRRPLQTFGLTSARFDLLHRLLPPSGRDPDPEDRNLQSDLQYALGLSRSVVSRMLRSLEVLGLVVRKWDEYDARQKCVMLTPRGLSAVRAAHQSLARAAQRLVYEALGGEGGHRDRTQRFCNMFGFDNYLFSFRNFFGDTARNIYYWGHPDD